MFSRRIAGATGSRIFFMLLAMYASAAFSQTIPVKPPTTSPTAAPRTLPQTRPTDIHTPTVPPRTATAIPVPAPTKVSVELYPPAAYYQLDGLTDGRLPQYLRGAVVAMRPFEPKPRYEKRNGRVSIQVAADGPVFLAVRRIRTGKYLDEVVSEFGAEYWSPVRLTESGWALVDVIHLMNRPVDRPMPYELLYRSCRAGETLTIRTDSFVPPMVIVPAAGAVPDLIDFEPDASLSEMVQRSSVAAKMAVLLQARRFDDIERLTSGYLTTAAHFPSGRSKFSATQEAIVRRTYYDLDPMDARRYVGLAREWMEKHPQSTAAKLNLAALFTEEARLPSDEPFDAVARTADVDADENRRRALEILFDMEQAGIVVPDLFASLVSLGISSDWDVGLVEEYVGRMLKSGAWCPEALTAALKYVTDHTPNKPVGATADKLVALFERVRKESQPHHGLALYAAVLRIPFTRLSDSYFRDLYLRWVDLKPAFEELDRRLPNSQFNKQCFSRWACLAGDRATAARLFEELGWVEYDERDRIWKNNDEHVAKRVWAAPDYQFGEQREYYDQPLRELVGAYWAKNMSTIFYCDVEGAVGVVDPKKGVQKVLHAVDHNTPGKLSYGSATTLDGERTAFAMCCGIIVYLDLANEKLTRIGEAGSMRRYLCVGFSRDKRRLFAGDTGRSVSVFDLDSKDVIGSRRRILSDMPETAVLMGTTDDGKFVLYRDDGIVQIFDLDTMQEIRSWRAAEPLSCRGALSPDGMLLATFGRDRTIRVWELSTGRKLSEFRKLTHSVESMAISPDNRWLVYSLGSSSLGFSSPLHVCDLRANIVRRQLNGHRGEILSLSFSPDGKTLLSSSMDMSIRLWNVNFDMPTKPIIITPRPNPSSTSPRPTSVRPPTLPK